MELMTIVTGPLTKDSTWRLTRKIADGVGMSVRFSTPLLPAPVASVSYLRVTVALAIVMVLRPMDAKPLLRPMLITVAHVETYAHRAFVITVYVLPSRAQAH